jgi:hypothetical protein
LASRANRRIDAILQDAQLDDLVVTVDEEPPDVIAARVLAAVGGCMAGRPDGSRR